jgi:hypothetical protein
MKTGFKPTDHMVELKQYIKGLMKWKVLY